MPEAMSCRLRRHRRARAIERGVDRGRRTPRDIVCATTHATSPVVRGSGCARNARELRRLQHAGHRGVDEQTIRGRVRGGRVTGGGVRPSPPGRSSWSARSAPTTSRRGRPAASDDDQLTAYKSGRRRRARTAAASMVVTAAQARGLGAHSAPHRRRLSGVGAISSRTVLTSGPSPRKPVVAGSTRRAATRQSSTPSPRIVVTALLSGVNVHGAPVEPDELERHGP